MTQTDAPADTASTGQLGLSLSPIPLDPIGHLKSAVGAVGNFARGVVRGPVDAVMGATAATFGVVIAVGGTIVTVVCILRTEGLATPHCLIGPGAGTLVAAGAFFGFAGYGGDIVYEKGRNGR